MKYLTTTTKIATLSALLVAPAFGATITHNLNVQIIQVRDDAGGDPTPLGPGGSGEGYLYKSQVQDIWAQAGVQVTFLPTTTWNNTEAQRLTNAERSDIYGNTFVSGSGDPLPGLAANAIQIFFVWDHSGTGYNGTENSGWKNDGSFNPLGGQNAGNASLFIDGIFLVMVGL